MTRCTFRLATAADEPAVRRLQTQFVTEMNDPLGIDENARPHAEFFLVEVADRVVGMMSLLRASQAPFVFEQTFPEAWQHGALPAALGRLGIRRSDLVEGDWGYIERPHRGHGLALVLFAGMMLHAHHRGYAACVGIPNQASLARFPPGTYKASSDLLTRRSQDSDFATDTSVRRKGRNPATGHRYLEELSFEIFFQESREYARTRARQVVASGVRRMFGIFARERYRDSDVDDVVEYTVAEWSVERDDWGMLAPGEVIDDPALHLPIPVEALTDGLASDDAAARALLARKNRVLEEREARVRREEHLATMRENIFEVLEHRKIALDASQRARIEACDDIAILKQWHIRAIDVRDAAALLG